MILLLIWLATFVNIMMQGVQSRNVNAGRYLWAANCSLILTFTQWTYIRSAVGLPTLTFFLITTTAAPAGICGAIWITRHVKRVR